MSQTVSPEKLETPYRCSCGAPAYATFAELGQHHTDTGHEGMYQPSDTIDGEPAKIVHSGVQIPIPIAPMTLATALEQVDAARERHARFKKELSDAKGFEKDAQGWLNTCVDQLVTIARREAEPELPLGLNEIPDA